MQKEGLVGVVVVGDGVDTSIGDGDVGVVGVGGNVGDVDNKGVDEDGERGDKGDRRLGRIGMARASVGRRGRGLCFFVLVLVVVFTEDGVGSCLRLWRTKD